MSTSNVTTMEDHQATRQPVTGYDQEVRFYATQYQQGGRMVYALDLSLAQIAGLIPAPDPEIPSPGNRRIQPAHAAAFAQYIRVTSNWVAPAIVLRAPTPFEFEVLEEVGGAEFGIISLPFLALSEIHILDGQHRILGIHMALRGISGDLDKARGILARAKKKTGDEAKAEARAAQEKIAELNDQRARFESERTSVQIFIEDEMQSFQQMFYDINDNVLSITASVRARFDTRKAVNRALTEVMEHVLLTGRVDIESDRLGRSNPHFLSAKHVADITRILAVGIDGRVSRRMEAEMKEETLIKDSNEFFDTIMKSFAQIAEMRKGELSPVELRNTSMLGSPVTLRVLAGTYRELRKRGWTRNRVEKFFGKLDKYLSVPATKEWVARTGEDLFQIGALAPGARRQQLKELSEIFVSWAVTTPDWFKD